MGMTTATCEATRDLTARLRDEVEDVVAIHRRREDDAGERQPERRQVDRRDVEREESFGVFERRDGGGPAVSFLGETLGALALGGFSSRQLPDEIGDGGSPEIPTAALVDPDGDEEEAVGFVTDLFGVDVTDSEEESNSGFSLL